MVCEVALILPYGKRERLYKKRLIYAKVIQKQQIKE